jgi:long-chain fatty acid transport protein
MWFNPAGLTAIPGTTLSASGTLIMPHGGFTDDFFAQKTDMPSQSYVVPAVYLARHMSDKVAAGIGLYAPYGLGTKWPIDFQGRFDAYKTSLKSIYIQPTIAIQATKWLSIGLGVAYIHGSVELHQRLDLSQQLVPAFFGLPAGATFAQIGVPTNTDFADGTLKASGNGVAVNGGIQIKVSDRLTIGGHFITHKTINYTGTVAFTPVKTELVFAPAPPLIPFAVPLDPVLLAQFAPDSALANGAASTSITMPDQGSVGFAYKAGGRWTLMGDYQQIVWGWFNNLAINFSNPKTPDQNLYEGFRASHAVRLGVEYQQSAKTVIRGGYLFHTAASPDQSVTPLLPEGERNEFTVGLGTQLSTGMKLDLAFQYIRQQDRRGRAGTTFNNGLYTFNAILLGAGLSYTF